MFAICDDDFFAVMTVQDEGIVGGYHCIYLCRKKLRPLFLFTSILLPSTEPSEDLLRVVDELALSLRIENRGYIGWFGLELALIRFLIRRKKIG